MQTTPTLEGEISRPPGELFLPYVAPKHRLTNEVRFPPFTVESLGKKMVPAWKDRTCRLMLLGLFEDVYLSADLKGRTQLDIHGAHEVLFL